jgi:hypothetical protein
MSQQRIRKFPLIHDHDIIPSWRRLRHGQNHRAPTRAEEEAELLAQFEADDRQREDDLREQEEREQ